MGGSGCAPAATPSPRGPCSLSPARREPPAGRPSPHPRPGAPSPPLQAAALSSAPSPGPAAATRLPRGLLPRRRPAARARGAKRRTTRARLPALRGLVLSLPRTAPRHPSAPRPRAPRAPRARGPGALALPLSHSPSRRVGVPGRSVYTAGRRPPLPPPRPPAVGPYSGGGARRRRACAVCVQRLGWSAAGARGP